MWNLVKIIWQGMSSREKLISLIASFVSIFALSFSILITSFFGISNSTITLTIVMALLHFITGGVAWSILGPRYLAILKNEGFICQSCGLYIGISDEKEAFLVNGVIGEFTSGFNFFVKCRDNHLTMINTEEALRVLENELFSYDLSIAKGNVERLKQRHDSYVERHGDSKKISHSEEIEKKLIEYNAEKDFVKNVQSLKSYGDLAGCENMTEQRLIDNLSEYYLKGWKSLSKNELYNFLINLFALMRLRKTSN